jgi:hypothetical protein
MKEMREGDMRHIYIHPAYGYGVLTTISPCTPLIAKVTLHQVNEQVKGILPPLTPIDIAWVKDSEFFNKVKEGNDQNARYMGYLWGTWLSKSRDIKFSVLCEHLKRLAGQQEVKSLSDKDYRLCNHVLWNLVVESP